MNQLVIMFRDPSLGASARDAVAELLGTTAGDDRIATSPSGSILVVRVDGQERLAVRRLMDRLGGTVMYDERDSAETLPRAS